MLCAALLCASCSTKVNTSGSRLWHSFTAHYNTYYNGQVAYIEGQKALDKGVKDNYTERLPVFAVSTQANADLGKGHYKTCIEKMQKAVTLHSIKKRPKVDTKKTLTPKQKQYLQRMEYNPFLKYCWLRMGQAQFFSGEFEEAGATFNYITRIYAAEPLVVAEARDWLARCYAQNDWLYDAEDVMARQARDTIPPRILGEHHATMADILLRQGKLEEAIPHLHATIKKCKSRTQKARLYYILGQVNTTLQHDAEAYQAFSKCAKTSPSYPLLFSAQIMQTENLGHDKQKAKKMISRLRRMARAEGNKDYLDQVYYAMGNIYMAQQDTSAAIGAYETGREKSTRSGLEKGVLLLRLGELYWDMRRFEKAQPCFSECISLLGKTHARYPEVMKRSKVLDELVPYTTAVQLQDSLQTLVRMPEAERMAAIDRVIDALKKKEAEERKARRDSAAQARADANDNTGFDGDSPMPTRPSMPNADKSWYFYNTQLVTQGKQDFRRQWGNRKNEDDWRRSNHTVVKMEADADDDADNGEDMGESGGTLAENDSTGVEESPNDSLALDPHQREYYLAQLPFTEEQLAASHDIIKDGLYNAGVIEKDKLDDFPLAAETLTRLITQYPECTQLEDALYHMFLLYSRWGKPTEADRYRQMLAQQFPDAPLTRMIIDPDFELLARYGLQIEDSLYTETYQAYRNRRNDVVNANFATSTRRFPNGLNRPKFMLIHALANLGTLPSDSILSSLRSLIKDYPKADVAEMAGMIIKGLESGRTIGDGLYDIGSLWDRRSASTAEMAAELKQHELVPDRNVPFTLVLAYPTGSINDDRLLYDVAHFNFNAFMVRGFDLGFEKDRVLTQLRISGFNNYDEVHAYTQKFYVEAGLQDVIKQGRLILISNDNLPLLGVTVSYDDYQKFFDEHYVPLQLPENIRELLEEPEVKTIYEDEQTTVVNESEEDESSDEGETYSSDDEEYEE